MSLFYCETCQREILTVTFTTPGRPNQNHCDVCGKDYCNYHWQKHCKEGCPPVASRTKQIKKLHKQLVENAVFLEAISTDDMQHIDVVVERNRIIEELVNVLKGTPCAPTPDQKLTKEQLFIEDAWLEVALQVKHQASKAWFAGFKTAVEYYAWWKDGVQYVGSCGKTLKQALEDAKQEQKGGS